MTDDFYRAFEDRYRGSRALIKSRLLVYVPFIEPLKSVYGEHKAIDLGCGRGEWLEILREIGYVELGVDLDDHMLAACRGLGLKVQTEEAVEFMKGLPDESQLVVSAFHLVEHILFESLQTLVQEALRVLKPGGLLILETPNPENIVVGTVNFYLDPTHQRPIPPQLLSFLPEHYGFVQTKILRLQEPEALANAKVPSLMDVFNGVSPDYAVVAQKGGNESAIAATRQAFGIDYGLTLETLAARYDGMAKKFVTEAEVRLVATETRVTLAEAVAIAAEISAAEAQMRAVQAETRVTLAEAVAIAAEISAAEAQMRAVQAETRATAAECLAMEAELTTHKALQQANDWHERLIVIHSSNSWKITMPIRALARIIKQEVSVTDLYSILIAKFKRFKRSRSWSISTIKWAVDRARSSPSFKRFALSLLRGRPGIQQKIRIIYLESKRNDQIQPESWPGTPIDVVTPSGLGVPGYTNGDIRQSPPQGVNSGQRSPLEKNFYDYRGQP
jgi:SAM-dependent methyltransferase